MFEAWLVGSSGMFTYYHNRSFPFIKLSVAIVAFIKIFAKVSKIREKSVKDRDVVNDQKLEKR